jgi:hypothetical protein
MVRRPFPNPPAGAHGGQAFFACSTNFLIGNWNSFTRIIFESFAGLGLSLGHRALVG